MTWICSEIRREKEAMEHTGNMLKVIYSASYMFIIKSLHYELSRVQKEGGGVSISKKECQFDE